MATAQLKPRALTSPPHTVVSASIGKKILMSISGVILLGFVCGHMLGNLQIFMGQDQINTYAEKLQSLGGLLWVIRLFLLAMVVIHIWKGIQVWWENKQARPESYAKESTVQATLMSRTMIYTGVAILLYVVYHLLHFTLIVTNPEYADLLDPMGRKDVFSMMVLGFQNVAISAVYIVAMTMLSFHLGHAVFSVFQTLGINNPKWQPKLRALGYLVAIFLFVGYVSIPVAVLSGYIALPPGVH